MRYLFLTLFMGCALSFCHTALWAEKGFLYLGSQIDHSKIVMTLIENGALLQVYRGGDDTLPTYRAEKKSDGLVVRSGLFPWSQQMIHYRQFGKWSYLVKGAVFTDDKVAYSIYTEGEFQRIYRGFVSSSSVAVASLIRNRDRTFIIKGESQNSGDVNYTSMRLIDRDYLQTGYQTGGGAISYTVEKGVGKTILFGGRQTPNSVALMRFENYRPDASLGIPFIFTAGGTYFNRTMDLPFLFALNDYKDLWRETVIALYFLENPSAGGCGG